MRIDNNTGAQALLPIAEENQRREEEERQGLGVSSWGADRLSFSPEALQMARAASTTRGVPSDSTTSEDGMASAEAALEEAAAGGHGAAGSAASDGAANAAERIKEIEAKIKELENQIAQVNQSAMPEGAKEARIDGLQAQISQLIAQKNELESAMMKNKA